MATENVIMALVKKGGDRQEAHEKIRVRISSRYFLFSSTDSPQVLSHEAGHQVKHLGLENDLIDRIRADPYFDPVKEELDALLDPKTFIGRAPEQVDTFLRDWVEPALAEKSLQEAIQKSSKVELNV